MRYVYIARLKYNCSCVSLCLFCRLSPAGYKSATCYRRPLVCVRDISADSNRAIGSLFCAESQLHTLGCQKMNNLIKHGLYSVKDNYFKEFKNNYWVDNKNEKRPYYYALKDSQGVDWLIPMSSQTISYSAKIEKIEAKRGTGNCVYYHIGKIASIDRVFLIGDMFPVAPLHVKAPFTIDKRHYIVKDADLNKVLYSKAMRFLQLVASGNIKSRNDIIGIKNKIIDKYHQTNG